MVPNEFDDVVRRLPAVRDMGFDVVYFPPIHPIGKTNRKGRNNALKAGPDDPAARLKGVTEMMETITALAVQT